MMKNESKFVYIAIVLIFLLGVFVRLKLYLANYSFWLDENSLYVAIKENYNYYSLLFPLGCMQIAPPLFLMISRFIILHIGIGELVLRFFPFLCSLISIPVFYIFSQIFLRRNLSVIIANFLFAVNVQLMHNAQVFKQYSSDVLIFMLIFIILNNLSIKRFEKNEFIYYTFITTISPLLALPSYFVIGGWFLRELFMNNFKYIKKLFVANIFCIVITFVYYVPMLFFQKYVIFSGLFSYWQAGFLSLNIINDIKLYTENIRYFFQPCNNYIFVSILIIFGIILLLKQIRKKENLLLFCSILLILLLGFIKVYPIIDRVCLYTLPFILIFMTKSCDYVSLKRKFYSIIVIAIFIIFFHQYKPIHIVKYYKPWHIVDARATMNALISKYGKKDIIIINDSSQSDYLYYKDYYKFFPEKEIFLQKTDSMPELKREIEKYTEQGKKYLFYCSCDSTGFEIKTIEEWAKYQNILYEKAFQKSKVLYLEKK